VTASKQTLDLSMDALEQRAKQVMAPVTAGAPPAVTRELDIEIVFRDHTGASKRGKVTSVIQSKIEESRQVAIMFADLTGGLPVASLPEGESQYLYQLAWVAAAIPERPPWFQKACADDDLMVSLVYQEVMAHRAKFLPDAGDHAAGEGAKGTPRVRVSSALSGAGTDGAQG
jgi:hypothetical protein